MRCLYILICFLISSCHAKQKVLTVNEVDRISIYCPEDGKCTFEILKNKFLLIQKDEFGNLYPEISEGNKIVLKFQYKRNEIPNTMDSSYSELIYAEIDTTNLKLEIENSQLQEVKLLFARLCFCRGQTGYYKVKNGKLSISKEIDKYRFNLEFKVNEVPQVITSINESFNINQ